MVAKNGRQLLAIRKIDRQLPGIGDCRLLRCRRGRIEKVLLLVREGEAALPVAMGGGWCNCRNSWWHSRCRRPCSASRQKVECVDEFLIRLGACRLRSSTFLELSLF